MIHNPNATSLLSTSRDVPIAGIDQTPSLSIKVFQILGEFFQSCYLILLGVSRSYWSRPIILRDGGPKDPDHDDGEQSEQRLK